jgi:hypothetical protein
MLATMHVLDVYAEKGVWDYAGTTGVAETAMYEGHSKQADQPAKPKFSEACKFIAISGTHT